MPVQTVLGKVSKESLGVISPHEHIFIDATCRYTLPDDHLFIGAETAKICMENLGLARRNAFLLKDNLIYDNYEIMLKELMYFKYAGGNTIVDVTIDGIGRSPKMLRQMAYDTGLNIIMGCGYYCASAHPAHVKTLSVEEIADEMLRDLTVGVKETGIKSGLIGEIGISDRMHPDEKKVLTAAARVQKQTGLGMHVHIFDWPVDGNRFPLGLEALDICEGQGADVTRIAINHMDVAADIDIDYCLEVARRGAYVQFDNFGQEFPNDRPTRRFVAGPNATDIDRVRKLKMLCDAGYKDQLMIACDLCKKTLLRHYGGWGFDHILTNIVHTMEDEGIDKETISQMLHDNPARFLDT